MGVRFLCAGDTAMVVEFGNRIDRDLSDRVLRLAARVRGAALAGVVETVPTYRSLMVHYDPVAVTAADLEIRLGALLEGDNAAASPARLWRIPACYEAAYAPDLEDVAQRTGLSAGRVIELHTENCFHIYMLGFVPGFPYMGDLPDALVLPRRADPRVRVPPGSIAIAQAMTAIYPLQTPGGWHLIGATPVSLFDAARDRPALFRPGDKVRFEPIGAARFEAIGQACAAGSYDIDSEEVIV